MRIRVAIPDRHVTAPILDSTLEATTLANQAAIADGEVPPLRDAIRAGVKWKPENYKDGEHFDLASTVVKRGWGDCDDLAPYLAAELRHEGDDGAHAFVKRNSDGNWHALVRDGDGRVIDPSRWAGMGKHVTKGVHGAVYHPMCPAGVCGITVMPHRGVWAARVDTPWGDDHLSSIALDGDLGEALERALDGACEVGDSLGLARVDDIDVVGSFFSHLTHPFAAAFHAATHPLDTIKRGLHDVTHPSDLLADATSAVPGAAMAQQLAAHLASQIPGFAQIAPMAMSAMLPGLPPGLAAQLLMPHPDAVPVKGPLPFALTF